MQRGLRITLAVAVAAGATVAGAGTAFASDNGGPVNVHRTPSGHHSKLGTHKPNINLPKIGGFLGR
jgi:hypothetical protein